MPSPVPSVLTISSEAGKNGGAGFDVLNVTGGKFVSSKRGVGKERKSYPLLNLLIVNCSYQSHTRKQEEEGGGGGGKLNGKKWKKTGKKRRGNMGKGKRRIRVDFSLFAPLPSIPPPSTLCRRSLWLYTHSSQDRGGLFFFFFFCLFPFFAASPPI